MMNRRGFLSISGRVLSGTCAALAASDPLNVLANETDTMPDYRKTGVKLRGSSNPDDDGFYFPAEWGEHEFTIMVMPPPQNWQGYGIPMADVRRQWAVVANKLSEFEPVEMIVDPREKRFAKRLLSRDIEIVELPVNDGWARDSGPMFVINDKGERRVAGFTFNGWGGKFPPYNDDALLKGHLCKRYKTEMYSIDLVLEGGAVALDGEGTVITTEQCLLNKNRNSEDRQRIETMIHRALGTSKVIWLKSGLVPDPVTDGHIDGLAAFIRPGVVMVHTIGDRRDPNYAICQDAKRKLQGATDAQGRKLQVIELPLDAELSHMNFYIANGCVLVPVTSRRRENQRPMSILKEQFPDHDVIGIRSEVLAEGGGGIHCITQQVPKRLRVSREE